MDTTWHSLMDAGIPVAEKAIRTVAVYIFLVAGLRLFGKRELGQLNPLDMIVLLLLANTVQNAIIGNDNSLAGGLIGAAILFVANDALVRLSYRRPHLRRLIEGRTEELVRDGHVIKRALEHNLITHEEIVAAARKQGIADLHHVESARLELSGQVSFTLREPLPAERMHDEIMARLERIERRLAGTASLVLLAAGLAWGTRAEAQGPTGTDVWVATMKESGGKPTFGAPRNMTNRRGYDNQPSFTARGDAVFYTVIAEDAQADIWRFALPDGKPVRVTTTPESEYSATVTPDGRTFSVIRVELDSTQRLWRFPLDGKGAPAKMVPDLKIGYHVWTGDHSLVVFVLGSPSTLQVGDDRTGAATVVASDIGRALGKVPGRDAVTFVQQVRDSAASGGGRGRATSWIAELDLRTRAVRRLMPPPPGADYHVWTPKGALIAAAGSKLFQWADNRWSEIADFSANGAKSISRLAISPRGDWIAFVTEDAPRP